MKLAIRDPDVDAVEFAWDPASPSRGPVVLNATTDLRMIKSFFRYTIWESHAQFLLAGALQHHQRVIEDSGFRFNSDLDPDDEKFDGVEMYDPIDTLYLSEAAFDRLMARYFTAIVDAVTRDDLPVQREVWWSSFVSDVKSLSLRAHAS